IADLFMLETKLFRVGNVLILASAAIPEVPAWRHDALCRGLQDSQQTRPSETGFDLCQFHFHRFAARHKRDKDHKTTPSTDAIAAEGDVVDGQGQFRAWGGKRRVHRFLTRRRSNAPVRVWPQGPGPGLRRWPLSARISRANDPRCWRAR